MESTKKRVLAIINPIAGTKNKAKIPQIIDQFLDKELWSCELRYTERVGHANELALDAVSRGIDCVVAIGGDGTVNEVARALTGTKTALAIVPCGSGNGLARHLHIPMNMARAVEVLNADHVETFDYCAVNERPFFCTCGVGFDAQVSYRFANEGTRGLVTYVRTTISEYFRYRPQPYELFVDDEHIHEDAFVIAVCNAAQYGNNAYIAPRATMQDGELDVTVIHRFNLLSAAVLGARLFTRSIDRDRHITIYRGRHIVIKRARADVMHIDGDPVMMPARLDITCHHQGISIMVPPHSQP